MSMVVPTITAENPHQYREQVERVKDFARHLHIDLMDGQFTQNQGVNTELLWLPDDITCDVHVMYQNPDAVLKQISKLNVRTVIVHVESQCDFKDFAKKVSKLKLRFGVALLSQTSVSSASEAIKLANHVLIFSGNLGHQGGSVADLNLLSKIQEVKQINPDVEIGWDGGVNDTNVKALADAGVDVINVGGFVHHAQDPSGKFRLLEQSLA